MRSGWVLRLFIALNATLVAGCGDREARDEVAANFRDPGSVEFRHFAMNGKTACGEFNAKNGFGAYVGFQRFVANINGKDRADIDLGPVDPISYEDLANRLPSDREACAYQRKYGQQHYHGCEMEPRDRAAWKASRAFDDAFQRCEGSSTR